ncbi:hypothetical protein [Dickeya dadantii]|uniref:hypothetical protein n=1 Tax=Dickeya dadantii TaxID=204038 RepID=UPI001CC5B00D|nr:hypothetical protein [Dickeya dadantii]UAY97102.1 hypothetical protein KTF62_04160 [Dickeya dadantii]
MKSPTQKNKFFLLAALLILVNTLLILTIHQDAPLIFLLALLVATAILATLSHYFHWFKLDDRQLFKQPLFIIVTTYPVYLFILFGAWIWKDYSLSLSSEGYRLFLEISKFPLIILASSVPLGAIVNNIHRTIQTEKQIDDAGAKNRNDIYYGHVKFILDQFDKIKGKKISHDYYLEESFNTSEENEVKTKVFKMELCIFIRQPMDLYRKIYKNSCPQKSSNFEVCPDFLRVLHDEWLKIHNLCLYKSERKPEQHFKSNQELRIKEYSDINITYTNICNLLCLGGFHSDYSLALQAKRSGWQWYSTFPTGAYMYNSLHSLAAVTGLILDRVRDENVDRLFPSNESVFKIGSGFIEDLNMFFDTICIGPYQPPTLAHLHGLHLEDSINKT